MKKDTIPNTKSGEDSARHIYCETILLVVISRLKAKKLFFYLPN